MKANDIQQMAGEEVEIERRDLELIEPQGSQEQIARFKAREAFRHVRRPLLVEDTGVYVDCLGGMPGPYMKCFTTAMGVEGLAKVVHALGNDGVTVRTIIALHLGGTGKSEKLKVFTGELRGRIVAPRGTQSAAIGSYDWNVIFVPEGEELSLGEMSEEVRRSITPRAIAFRKMLEYIKELNPVEPEISTAASAPNLLYASTLAQNGDMQRSEPAPVLSMQDLDCTRPTQPNNQ